MPRGDSAIVYSAILRPHRSGGRLAGRVVLILAGLIWLPVGLAVWLIGAWPVLPFLGLELVLLALALAFSRRAGNAFEAINLSRLALTVRRVDHWGAQSSVSFAPHWLQVNIDPLDAGDNRLELRSHGRSLTIGRFLVPEERLVLAHALRRELSRLRFGAEAKCEQG